MPRRTLGWAAACAAALALGAGACSPSTVRLAYAPETGETRTYRYEVHATVTQVLEGEAPVRSAVEAVLSVEEEILEVYPGGAVARLEVRRDGGAPRVVEVRLDRSGTLAGIDLVEGGEPSVDLGLVQGVLASLPLPSGSLRPGDEWEVEDASLIGHGRLRQLAIVDDQDTAVVEVATVQEVDDQLPTGGTVATATGSIRSDATTTYDLDGGAVRRSRVRAHGAVALVISPPPGIDAAPARGSVSYEVRVTVTRLA